MSIPTGYALVVSNGVAHLVMHGASGPPYLVVCGQSVAAPIETEHLDSFTPCPRCSHARREPRRWRGWGPR